MSKAMSALCDAFCPNQCNAIWSSKSCGCLMQFPLEIFFCYTDVVCGRVSGLLVGDPV